VCGICGKVLFQDGIVDRNLIHRMNETLVHRGPDDEGIHTAPHIGLGQRRLSIIDLSPTAAPPLSNEDETIWVVFNGEIYNFQSLREDLLTKGHIFKTRCDTEVIVHLYEEYGIECLSRMRGMFAFAIWDSRQRQLFAARDRLGKKPFCYTKTQNSLVFGSEIKAIVVDPDVSVAPNFRAIERYLTFQYVPSPLSAFEGIEKLPPGHFLICSAQGDLKIQRYWEPPLAEKIDASEEEIQEEIRRRLRESVRLRMISDVPLGAFLSGGLDSTTIVALMAEESSQPVKTFSIGFQDEKSDELPYARALAEKYGTDHHEFIVEPKAADVLPLLVRHYNEPFADPSAIPTYYVSKATREHVTVAITGDGGDENFSGYHRYAKILSWSGLDVLPVPVRNILAGGTKTVLEKLPYNNLFARLCRGAAMIKSDLRDRYLLEMSVGLKQEEKEILYTRDFKRMLAADDTYVHPIATFPYSENMDALDWMMRHDQNFYLPDCLMVKTDIASMANSLEVRCPILDHEFVEFTATIPSGMKRGSSGGKAIFKKAVKELLPQEILDKPKTGFAPPVARWLRNDLSGMLRETLLDDRSARRGLFEGRSLNRMVDEHIEGKRDWSNRLWALLFLELWFRECID